MRILFVCLGNICRSPAAEGVLRTLAAREAPDLVLAVDSAGTGNYHIGEPPDPRMIRAAGQRGYDLSVLRARQIEHADFSRFDLMLAMDRQNQSDILERASSVQSQQVRLFMEYAPEIGVPEVPDPYYGGPEGFERVLDLVEAASRGLIARLQSS
ncbi:MAG: low molecular weight phosphotyrosine protein phosphatase [Gammaproteobacteria bacterium]|nr:low molecular weight phosphotyrosine protein phosphatase [Gammaproteobacteria bacterium]